MKTTITVLASIILVYAVFIGIVFFAQRNLMYFPGYDKPDLKQSGIAGLQEISVTTDDSVKLFAWYQPPTTPEKPTIVWFHGNASNVGGSAARAIPYVKAGYGVLLAEYRGYATNPGHPSEAGFYKDAQAYMNWLKITGTPENNIILYGESIGTGVAVQMAVDYPGVHALVLEAPFTSMLDIAGQKYPFMPVNFMLKDKYDNIAKIRNIKAPLIVVHGRKDTIIPYVSGEKLFNAAPEPKSMVSVEEAGHNDLINYDISSKVMSILSE